MGGLDIGLGGGEGMRERLWVRLKDKHIHWVVSLKKFYTFWKKNQIYLSVLYEVI